MKNHENENHHCKKIIKSLVNECSFQKEKLDKLVKIYKINDNASAEDSNFSLEEVNGKPKYGFRISKPLTFFDWDELPPKEYCYT